MPDENTQNTGSDDSFSINTNSGPQTSQDNPATAANPLNTGGGTQATPPEENIKTETPTEEPHEIEPENLQGEGTSAPEAPAVENPALEISPAETPAPEIPSVESPIAETAQTNPASETSTAEPTQEELDKKLEESLAQASPESSQETVETNKGKLYIIIGLIVLIAAGGAFAAYKIYFTDNEEESSEESAEESSEESAADASETTPGTEIPPKINITGLEEETPSTEASKEMKELDKVVNGLKDAYEPDGIETYDEAVLEEVDSNSAAEVKIPAEESETEESETEPKKVPR